MKDDSPEVVLDLEQILVGMTRAMAKASADFRAEQAKRDDLLYTYHMPHMKASISLSFTYSEGRIKGIFRKKTTSNVQEFTSTIDLEVVSVPRPPLPPAQ